MWVVGNTEYNGDILMKDDAEITTGTATIEYFINDAGTFKYLDSDESTLTTTRTTLPAVYVANRGWGHDLIVPGAFAGNTVHWILRHSVYEFIATESHYVTSNDLDGPGDGATVVA